MVFIEKMPSLFISHGPPLIASRGDPAIDFLKTIGENIPTPKGIICISAHFEAVNPRVTSTKSPETIHDFLGPPDLFKIRYPSPGMPELADRVKRILCSSGLDAECMPDRGLDHGAWIPLMFMYPDADIPVIQLSVQSGNDPLHHFNMGEALKSLREKNILILGSGGAVHNIDATGDYEIDSSPPNYAEEFDNSLNEAITKGDIETLINYKQQIPDSDKCHPYPAEHFLPLFVPLGAADDKRGVRIYEGFLYGTLGMAAYRWD